MKKILIGTHNQGKFREISHLITKKIKKVSPKSLNIKSPKETGKTFKSNSKLKANFFSSFVAYPVISDDSGLCIKSLNNYPGIYSARLAKEKGGFKNERFGYNGSPNPHQAAADDDRPARHRHLLRNDRSRLRAGRCFRGRR